MGPGRRLLLLLVVVVVVITWGQLVGCGGRHLLHGHGGGALGRRLDGLLVVQLGPVCCWEIGARKWKLVKKVFQLVSKLVSKLVSDFVVSVELVFK